MEGIILGLITFIGWGTGDIFGTLTSRKIGSVSATAWASILGLCVLTLYVPFAFNDLRGYTLPLLLFNVFIAIFSIIGNLAFNESLRVGVPSLVSTISSTFPAITILSAIAFFHESPSLLHIFFIIVIFIGVVIASLDPRDFLKGKRKIEKGVLLALLAMISWGIYSSLLRVVYPYVGWFWPIYITLAMFPLTLVYLKIRKEKLVNIFAKKAFFVLLIYTLLTRIGDLSLNRSVGRGLASTTGPFAASAPVLFAIIAYFLFKEKPNFRQKIGIVVTLVGIVSLSIF